MALNESVKRFPLSLSQLNILNLERVLAGTSVNNISTTVRISGRLDFPILQQSISLVVERDPSLRTRLVEENGEVLQYHAPFEKESYPVYDFTNTSKEGIENRKGIEKGNLRKNRQIKTKRRKIVKNQPAFFFFNIRNRTECRSILRDTVRFR